MSALQPGNEWETPPYGSAPDAQRRAATFVWITAAAEVLFFGCCASFAALARLIPLGQFLAQAARQHQQMSREQLTTMYGLLWPIAAALLITGFLPGLAYALLGFGVRDGRRPQIYIALLLSTTQLIVFGTLLLLGIAQSIGTGNAPGMTFDVLLMGSLLLLLGYTTFWLFRAKAGSDQSPKPGNQPWNNPPHNPSPPAPPASPEGR